jgi:hypothetical protein
VVGLSSLDLTPSHPPSEERTWTTQGSATSGNGFEALTRCRSSRHVCRASKAIRGGSVHECLDWLARYVDVGARHLILRIGAFDARPEMIAERLLPALRSLAPSE